MHHRVERVPCIVDEEMNLPVAAEGPCLFHRALEVGLVRDVADEGFRAAGAVGLVDTVGDGAGFGGVEVADEDAAAFGGEEAGALGTDALAGAGDDGGLVGEEALGVVEVGGDLGEAGGWGGHCGRGDWVGEVRKLGV